MFCVFYVFCVCTRRFISEEGVEGKRKKREGVNEYRGEEDKGGDVMASVLTEDDSGTKSATKSLRSRDAAFEPKYVPTFWR